MVVTTTGFSGFGLHCQPLTGIVTLNSALTYDLVEDNGLEPMTSCMPCSGVMVPSVNPSEVTTSHSDGCTTGCTTGTEKAVLKPPESGTRAIASDGFAAALLMIAGLPLSNEERAEAVRRLLNRE